MMILQLLGIILLLSFLAITFMWMFTYNTGRGVSKIRMIADALPGDDCGGCGYASCQIFAQAVTTGSEQMVSKCSLMSEREQRHVENLLGYQLRAKSEASDKVAIIACAEAGSQLPPRVSLDNVQWSCEAVVHSVGSHALCYEACIGMGDCIPWCPIGAINRDTDGKITIDEHKCTGCGICVQRCPKSVIKLVERSSLVQVQCSSQASSETKAIVCPTGGCTACNECAKVSAKSAFVINDNLAQRGDGSIRAQEIERILASCPTAVIKSLEHRLLTTVESKIQEK